MLKLSGLQRVVGNIAVEYFRSRIREFTIGWKFIVDRALIGLKQLDIVKLSARKNKKLKPLQGSWLRHAECGFNLRCLR
jgi:hypothetical protein